jgi:uncharacterized protein
LREVDAMLSPTEITLTVFLIGTFVAAFVTGLAGFAFGLVAVAIWLHALTPIQATSLIAAYALLVQGYAVWRLRRTLNVKRLTPFVLGSVLGVPAGVAALNWVSPSHLRIMVGMLLVVFSLYNLARPKLPEMKDAGRGADASIGLLNGLIGGSTGLAGIFLVIWASLRGWPRDEQRAVFQPAAVATFLMTILVLGGAGIITRDTAQLFLLGLPALAAGTWLGWKLYGTLDEASFRRVVLILLLVSGFALVSIGR